MTETPEHSHENEEPDDKPAGLYVTDAQIIRKWGFSLKTGYRIMHQLEQPNRARRPYPQRDPLFGNRRFLPEVVQWHLDYHRVGVGTPQLAPSDQPRWQENFDASPREASRTRHARA